ncbi:MAG TPA: hypothetical protein VHK47_22880 [Polyangia bacterium]|nr:hypothetical protein [Polyangia bacterium]
MAKSRTARESRDHAHWDIQRPPANPGGPAYQKFRDQIQTGDILLFRGHYFLSSWIERLSNAPYSHVAILARWGDRIVAFQSDHRGAELLPASRIVCMYNGDVDWWALKAEHRPKIHEPSLWDSAFSVLGTQFGNWELVKLAVKIIAGQKLSKRDGRMPPRSLFCSQYVSRMLRECSNNVLDPNPRANDLSTSPGDIARSGLFEARERLYDGSAGKACEAGLVSQVVWTGEAAVTRPVGS